jgi:hypothetical protein
MLASVGSRSWPGCGGGGEYAESRAPVTATVNAMTIPVAGTSAVHPRRERRATTMATISSAPAAKNP